MKPSYQSSKLYQADLYDQIKGDGNHIVCLSQDQTKTFILLAAIKNRAHLLHGKYGPFNTIIVEPDKKNADERQRIITDHSELRVTNLFTTTTTNNNINNNGDQCPSDQIAQPHKSTQSLADFSQSRLLADGSIGQVVICSLEQAIALKNSSSFANFAVNLVILDTGHLMITSEQEKVSQLVDLFHGNQIIVFMCSLIHNCYEFKPNDTTMLIKKLESIFTAKCETSSDLRSLSRQSPSPKIEIIEFTPAEFVLCDWVLLADHMLKQFCDFMLQTGLDENKPMIKPESELSDLASKGPLLSTKKQLVLTRSCLSDLIYSLLCLGVWCTKKTMQIYITEFSRLLQLDIPVGDTVPAVLTMLNSFYGRLDEISEHMSNINNQDLSLFTATPQLKHLLDAIKEFKPALNTPQPICIVHVRRRVIAKVMALWLDRISREFEEYSFIKANYIVGSSRKHRNRMAVDSFDLHHEAAVRDFRFGNCNVLVTSATNERSMDRPRCNLVVGFDLPNRFAEFIQTKGNCRFDSSRYIIMLNHLLESNPKERLLNFIDMERLLNNTNKRLGLLSANDTMLLESLESEYPPYPRSNCRNPATPLRSAAIINKYCTKLPSDSFTKLSPEWTIHKDKSGQFICEVRLPINSPVRQTIVGPPAPSQGVAMRLAALTACKVLHKAGELDDNMLPITKESMKNLHSVKGEPSGPARSRGGPRGQSVGSTKHRQYYRKRIANVFSGPLITAGVECYLYKFKMVLTCPIPDEQNRRGRRIIDPGETNRNYSIVCSRKLPKICAFPVFTRSGELLISVELVREQFMLESEQVRNLRIFHEYTFSKVLRLEKYPTVFDPDKSPFTVLLAPVVDHGDDTEIDWSFVEKIVTSEVEPKVPSIEERKKFQFRREDYEDAVVIPWYRITDCQQFAYYVAEICTELAPGSAFPDESNRYKTFRDYYESKYDISICNKEQPVLDVDHTSARLNLLTPRYVNRKGRTLPSSTAKTRRESRESLVQKQLLIPELCSIHPFPASFWRKAACLPCIFYRLNSLFLAEELRREVAAETRVGFVEPPPNFEWPQLDFGWSLKDVISNQSNDDDDDVMNGLCTKSPVETGRKSEKSKDEDKVETNKTEVHSDSGLGEIKQVQSPSCGEGDFVIDVFDPSKLDIPDIPLDAPADEWMNIKLISSDTSNANFSSGRGWDQPLLQQDMFIEPTSDITWDDCEMEFDGEITEKMGQLRCGSPSSFEPSTKFKEPQQKFSLNIQNSNGPKQLKAGHSSESSPAQITADPNYDSDASWSVSDDVACNSDEADTEFKSDDDEWKESKSKSKPVLRELFIAISRSTLAEDNGDVSSLYKLIKSTAESILQTNDETEGTSETSLQTRVLPETSEQTVLSILNSIFEKPIEASEEEIHKSLQEWYGRLRALTERIDTDLYREPDLFKDNGIELVTVDDSFEDYDLEMQPTFGELLPNRDADHDWSSEEWKNIKFDATNKEVKTNGPGPSIILQALTMSNASDGINLERLETVGDSFLKYSITAYLYVRYPLMHEGKLSYLRSQEISNANLYKKGRAKRFGEIMSATKFEPNDNWLAPGYVVAENIECLDQKGQPINSNSKNRKIEIDKALAEVPYDLLLQHSITDKSVADCVEALIGAYLTASGSRAALLFMRWLGLSVIPDSFDLETDIKEAAKQDDEGIWRWLSLPPSPLICLPPSYDDKINEIDLPTPAELGQQALAKLDQLYYADNLDKFECDIGYTFKDRAYLVQAFTHNSFYENQVTDCHQRLEFLGDALLDYLITRYLFEDPRCHSPGTLTDLRSALVNNTFFASLSVKYKFHKYLKYISDDLFHVIDGFVKKFRFDSRDTITKGYTLLITEGESEYAEDIEVPKALGDVFESVAGAIYLDSGMSLDQVWQVYFKMMKPEIEYFSSNVPKSPIRELLESMPQNVRFSPSELAPDMKHRVIAEVFGLGRFTGVGRSKHSAKSTAAKRALRMLALKKRESNQQL